jgi:hypothetical protein
MEQQTTHPSHELPFNISVNFQHPVMAAVMAMMSVHLQHDQ